VGSGIFKSKDPLPYQLTNRTQAHPEAVA